MTTGPSPAFPESCITNYLIAQVLPMTGMFEQASRFPRAHAVAQFNADTRMYGRFIPPSHPRCRWIHRLVSSAPRSWC
ncbi:MAG: hypothetical protein C0184_00775 [Chloroflexus aggregans]|uniref:Uncharacterized protein n=1 Tax=Chloroflexus aggregans TaxID=152260 RepID=A0A2J6XFJ9_9CHLR|nr:MAG: hypothetical protein C0184_00775 [Chloroflexus aggregans]